MAVRCAPALGFLEQKIGDSRRPRSLFFDDLDFYYHPVHAGRLGCLCRRLSRYDRERCILAEGSRDIRGIVLSAEAGSCQSVAIKKISAGARTAGSLN